MPIIRLSEVPENSEIGADGDTLIMRKAIGAKTRDPAFAMPHQTESLSITHIKLWGRLRQMTCHESDRVMFVIEGDGITRVGEEDPRYVSAGDFILIPQGTSYEFDGSITYLVINSPAYREGSDLRDDSYDGPPVRRGDA